MCCGKLWIPSLSVSLVSYYSGILVYEDHFTSDYKKTTYLFEGNGSIIKGITICSMIEHVFGPGSKESYSNVSISR